MVVGLLVLLFCVSGGLSMQSYLNPALPAQNWQVDNQDETYALLQWQEKSADDWQLYDTGLLRELITQPLSPENSYELLLYGNGARTTQPIGVKRHRMTKVTVGREEVELPCREEFPDIGLTVERCAENGTVTDHLVEQPTWQERARDAATGRLASIGIEINGLGQDPPSLYRLRQLLLASSSVDVIYRIRAEPTGYWQTAASIQQIETDFGPILTHSQVIWWNIGSVPPETPLQNLLLQFDGTLQLGNGEDLSWIEKLQKVFEPDRNVLVTEQEILAKLGKSVLNAIQPQVVLIRPSPPLIDVAIITATSTDPIIPIVTITQTDSTDHLFSTPPPMITGIPAGIARILNERKLGEYITWGDVDNDGDLDLAVGGNLLQIYDNHEGKMTVNWAASEQNLAITSIALADVDNDGDLDLAVGSSDYGIRLYDNYGKDFDGKLIFDLGWQASYINGGSSIAWGDVDNDGDLDLAVGDFTSIRLYYNDGIVGGKIFFTLGWLEKPIGGASSVAWGDVDDDGYIDLANGGSIGIGLYHNAERTLTATWNSQDGEHATDIAWGDVDNDGDLDLVATGTLLRLYRNDRGTLLLNPIWLSDDHTEQISNGLAWGDVDNDGDLDLAVGSPLRLYRNDKGVLNVNPIWRASENDSTTSITWADVDADGDYDLAAGNAFAPKRLYRNESGTLTASSVWESIAN
ncbi:MAG: VCBS repeat-containing protein [Caldilineaceae bacterium]